MCVEHIGPPTESRRTFVLLTSKTQRFSLAWAVREVMRRGALFLRNVGSAPTQRVNKLNYRNFHSFTYAGGAIHRSVCQLSDGPRSLACPPTCALTFRNPSGY